MANLALPDIHELDGVIADYFDALFPEMQSVAERASIIERCAEPFTQLIAMWESAHARGPVAEQIWRTFMRDLCLMSEFPAFSKNDASEGHNAAIASKIGIEIVSFRYRENAVKTGDMQGNIFACSST
jgi:hypothetical protein